MIRLLLLLAIVVVAVLLVRRLFAHAGRKGSTPAPAAPPGDAAPEDAKLVRCVECGAFVPKAAALPAPGGFRCGGAGCAPR